MNKIKKGAALLAVTGSIAGIGAVGASSASAMGYGYERSCHNTSNCGLYGNAGRAGHWVTWNVATPTTGGKGFYVTVGGNKSGRHTYHFTSSTRVVHAYKFYVRAGENFGMTAGTTNGSRVGTIHLYG